MSKLSFPIRLKVLVAVLVILMLVVGIITATMANLFEQDKTAYVRDFSSAVTSNMQAEVDTLLDSYVSATRVLSEVLFADYLEPEVKQQLAKPIFVAYPELLALVTTSSGGKPVSLYNNAAIRTAGVDPIELLQLSSLATLHEAGRVHADL